MPGSLPGFRGDMDVDQEFPALLQQARPALPAQGSPESPTLHSGTTSSSPKSSSSSPGSSSSWPRFHCSCPGSTAAAPGAAGIPRTQKLRFTFCSGPVMAPCFLSPGRISHALHTSPLGKYIIEGETRSLGNGSALVVALWESVIPKVPILQDVTFT
ncbi:hypothetical protein GWK47_053442 [Chionoecetes opilio]|uniref:Uncharacterized protein n=1 Tax=Chionoecetes opilio TaxID=41210 RepID=A0A8J4Y0Y5_CHIOP|nr:hypothetical protein GWK47_053442 [Chionoecetes opilio]